MSPIPAPSKGDASRRSTRRRVMQSGAKLVYAAPMVATTMRLGNRDASAKAEACLQDGKIGICHKDGKSGKYSFVCVSNNATKGGHARHAGDIIGVASAAECPTGGVGPSL